MSDWWIEDEDSEELFVEQRRYEEVGIALRELLALRTAAEGMEKALEESKTILEYFARKNPKWTDYAGHEQDPYGVHRLITETCAALAAYRKAVGR